MASGYSVEAFGKTCVAGVSEAWTLLWGGSGTEGNQRRLGIQNTFELIWLLPKDMKVFVSIFSSVDHRTGCVPATSNDHD